MRWKPEVPDVWVCELQGKTIARGNSSKKTADLVCFEQFPRQVRWADFTSNFNKENSDLHLQKVNKKYYNQDQKVPSSTKLKEGTIKLINLWI